MARIWIDLSNSPHVLFFAPLMRLLRNEGHHIILSARDFAQTLPLCRRYGLEPEVIGTHGGQGKVKKLLNIVERAMQLRQFAKTTQAQLAISHNSYAQIAAARSLGLPTLTAMDYEFQPANHLAFRLAHRVLLPESFNTEAAKRMGAHHNSARYPGLKEQVYLAHFKPNATFSAERNALFEPEKNPAPSERRFVTLRPPATMATYHNFQNPLFNHLFTRLGELAPKGVRVVLLPRTPEQSMELQQILPDNMRIPTTPLDGPNLISHSDLLISAGGTMVREAVALGVKTATVYWGRLGGVDKELINSGRLLRLQEPRDVDDLLDQLMGTPPMRGDIRERPVVADHLSAQLLREIETLLQKQI